VNLIDGLLGNAAQVDAQKIQNAHQEVLVPGEEVQAAFRVIRDLFIFTNKRLILVDKQGLTGKKVEYLSIPYRSIRYFSIETAGRFDRDAELKVWTASSSTPTVVKELKKGVDIIGLQRTLAHFVLG
jgi:hypothetical protein